ncbi:hypothetical protein SE17_17670 [Kouleothrix aurantiaca]|uniref:Type II secretion system protein GspF domain-containing protein n=1 Tax=Kouleothrix aurantiaca TaxID=186479 RepID=A0A0P9DPL1_9CHLR|nr:hypothetical protein SE17_17670 [Kouleothrix aurantiaca]
MDFLVSSSAPYFALSLAGAMVAAFGLTRLERSRWAAFGVRVLPNHSEMSGRLLIGQIAGIPLAFILILIALISGSAAGYRNLLFMLAIGVYLYIGVVIPRRPIVEAQKAARRLRQLTPGLVSYIQVSLAGGDSPMVILERYIEKPLKKRALMQAVVGDAVKMTRDRYIRPFDALRVVARARGCIELIDVTDALATSEAEGTDPQAVLSAQQATLEQVLRDEFTRMLKRRTMYLLLTVAISLVIGILGNLLFVMTGGGSVLMNLGA